MTIYFDRTARNVRDFPVLEAEHAARVQLAAAAAGALNPIRPDVFAQTVRESGPGEKRTCEDVFAAMVRLVDAKDRSYRD